MNFDLCVTQLVSNFQAEASAQKQEAESAKTKLAAVRKLIAKLLKSTNEVGFTGAVISGGMGVCVLKHEVCEYGSALAHACG